MTKKAHIWFREQIELLLTSGEEQKAIDIAYCYAVARDYGCKSCSEVDKLPERVSFILRQAELRTEYQPKTGISCYCKKGRERDNCPNCEGTGYVIDFAAIRARNKHFREG